MALVRYYSAPENKYLLIGAGFLGTGFLDGYHTVVTSTYFAPYMPSQLPSLIPWSWVASRLFLAVMLALTWYVWSIEDKVKKNLDLNPAIVYSATGIATIGCFLFFVFSPLPPAYYENIPFHFHRPEELLPGLFFLIAFIGFLKKKEWKIDAFEYWLLICILVNFIGESGVMVFLKSLYDFDFDFDFAHFLKDTSYVAALTGLLISMYNAFVKLQTLMIEEKKHIAALHKREEALVHANQDLESFSYSVSHDLRTPLRAIDGFSLILLEDYNDKLDDEGKRLLGVVRQSTVRMSSLINILAKSKRQVKF
jgi:signal transduction histidine kinase